MGELKACHCGLIHAWIAYERMLAEKDNQIRQGVKQRNHRGFCFEPHHDFTEMAMLILLFYGILHCCILPISSNDLFEPQPTLPCSVGCRDHLGDCTVVGDKRWAGSYGFDVDCVALDHSSALFVNLNEIEVGFPNSQPHT